MTYGLTYRLKSGQTLFDANDDYTQGTADKTDNVDKDANKCGMMMVMMMMMMMLVHIML